MNKDSFNIVINGFERIGKLCAKSADELKVLKGESSEILSKATDEKTEMVYNLLEEIVELNSPLSADSSDEEE